MTNVFVYFISGENINICWSPDGQTIAVGNKDDVVTFIDAKTHRSKAEEQFKFEVNEISWNNDNDMFFLTNGNGCINILRYEHGEGKGGNCGREGRGRDGAMTQEQSCKISARKTLAAVCSEKSSNRFFCREILSSGNSYSILQSVNVAAVTTV